MTDRQLDFQAFIKPVGSLCNLACGYCYYCHKGKLFPQGESFLMPQDLLEEYIKQHIAASTDEIIRFSWHGGEPTLAGLDYFKKIVDWQHKALPPGRRIANGMQTNGILLDGEWCRFLANEGFSVGLSLDGPAGFHDMYRTAIDGQPSHERTMHGYELLKRHNIPTDILCVVHAHNVCFPLEIYRFFRGIEASYITFLPLVEPMTGGGKGVSPRTVPSEAWGIFLSSIFDEWLTRDIGRIKVQIFEEAARTAFGQEHSLCLFRPVCGTIPVIEHNGDFFCCDHYVDGQHHLGNIRQTTLQELLQHPAQRAFGRAKLEALPRICRQCPVLEMCHGECPKNRFLWTPEGEAGWNYLCAGYKHFFTHCRPFITAVAEQWRQQHGNSKTISMSPVNRTVPVVKTSARSLTGRNEPCPCGSGRKYKKCCLGKG